MDISKNIFKDEGSDALEQVAQRSCTSTAFPSLEVFHVSLDGVLSDLI